MHARVECVLRLCSALLAVVAWAGRPSIKLTQSRETFAFKCIIVWPTTGACNGIDMYTLCYTLSTRYLHGTENKMTRPDRPRTGTLCSSPLRFEFAFSPLLEIDKWSLVAQVDGTSTTQQHTHTKKSNRKWRGVLLGNEKHDPRE